MSPNPPLFFLIVGDIFLTEEKFNSILSTLKKNGRGEIVCSHFRLGETPLEEVMVQARSLPFFAQAQVFKLQDAEALKERDLELLEQYMALPSPDTYLILTSESMAKNAKLVTLIKKKGEVSWIDDLQKKTSGNRFIQEKLARYGKKINPNAAARLMDQMGDAPVFLDTVLEQLALYAGSQKEIDESMVEKFEESWQEMDVFQLTNRIAERKMGEAIRLLKRMLQAGEAEPTALLGILNWQVRRLWQAKWMLERGFSGQTVLNACRVYGGQSPHFLKQLANYPLSKLERAIENLFQMDWKMKTGMVAPEIGLETWTIETLA